MSMHSIRCRYRNWLNRRAIIRGRSPLPERLTRPLRSSLPVYRNRVSPATGRPRRDDRQLGKTMDRSLAQRARAAHAANPPKRGRSR